MKTPVLFSCMIWLICFGFVIHLLFSITSEDEKSYDKHVAYILENSTKASSHPITQHKESVKKEFWGKDIQGTLVAKKARWIFDPQKKIYIEEFEKMKGEIFQEGSVKRLRAIAGSFNFKTHELSMKNIHTSFCYPTENGQMANVSSSSKYGVFHLDPKNPSFTLDKTQGKIVQ